MGTDDLFGHMGHYFSTYSNYEINIKMFYNAGKKKFINNDITKNYFRSGDSYRSFFCLFQD